MVALRNGHRKLGITEAHQVPIFKDLMDSKALWLAANSETVYASTLMDLKAGGPIDIYFGPEAPAGKEHNWVQTVPGKAFSLRLHLYGQLDPWFDKTWRPGEIEVINSMRNITSVDSGVYQVRSCEGGMRNSKADVTS